MTPPIRWRVDCRKDRRGWRTVLYEVYDCLDEAYTALRVHVLTEDWDSVDVVKVVGAQGEERRLRAAGARVRCPCEER